MVTRRTLLKQGACAALAWRAAPALIGTAYAATLSGFDYYIGPNGEDTNPGTYAKPWSITAINTHRAVYAGKRVGLLDGTYNVHALCQKGGGNVPALGVNGGPNAATPTVIAAVNPRQAILTAANPLNGAYATAACPIIGQGYLQTQNKGNVIIDGLYLTRSYQYAIAFYAPVGQAFMTTHVEGGSTGFVVRNCEIYDIAGLINNNVAGILLYYCTGALLSNNKIHSIQPPNVQNASLGDCAGIISFNSHANIYQYNTIYDCNVGIYDKNNYNGNHTYRYNYIECAGLTPFAALNDCAGGNPGDTLTVHNNILQGPSIWNGVDALVVPSAQGLVFYNNTCVYGAGQKAGYGMTYPAKANTISPAAMVTFYNNIMQCAGEVGYAGIVNLCQGSIRLSDYNAFSCASGTPLIALATLAQPRGIPKVYSLTQWRSVTGMDYHSSTSAPLFMSAQDRTATGLQLRSGSPALSAGRAGGVSTGAPTELGAWGGGATQIGCNFGPAPKPVSLSVT